jgi:hypothetical protein
VSDVDTGNVIPAIYEVAMNSEEQTLIDGLFSRLQQAETEAAPRDAQAETRIKEHLMRQPAAGYFMTQAILVQEAAIKSLDEQNKQLTRQVQQLQADLQAAKAQGAAPAPSGGGFLSSIFGSSPRPAPTQSTPRPQVAGANRRRSRTTRRLRHNRTSAHRRPTMHNKQPRQPAAAFSVAH